MVAQADIARVNALVEELDTIRDALRNFDEGGTIVQMTVAVPTQMPVTVNTMEISYPQQMVEGIRSALHERQGVLAKELTDLGVTLEPAPIAAAASAGANPHEAHHRARHH